VGKVLWHITMSLDGFIAGPGDAMGWMGAYVGPNPTANDLLGQIGALLIGARTYQAAQTEEGKVYGGAWSGPQFVLTHAAPDTAASGFTFVSGDIGAAVHRVKTVAGDKYAVILGASTAKQVLEAAMLDEILVHIAPVLLGDGVRLFNHPGGSIVRLEKISLTQSSQVTNLWLRVRYQ
jgi:dihydrofolate reductase